MGDWSEFFSAPIFAQNSVPQPYTITPGPDYNKWDEALYKYGAIRFPKELDEPQQWLSQDHFVKMLRSNGIDRIDHPDGSVVLRKQVPTS